MLRILNDGPARCRRSVSQSFDPLADSADNAGPCYGYPEEFDVIVDQLEAACQGILKFLLDAGS